MTTERPFPHARPLTLVVPHGRGGSTDTAVRIVTRDAERYLGCPLHIINLRGVHGFFALDLMVDSIKAKPDGYSLSTANSGIILSPLTSDTKYVYMDEIRPIAMSAQEPFFLVARRDAPWDTVDQLIADARANPGVIHYGHSGVGNVSFIIAEMLNVMAGVELAPQGYDSGGQLAESFAAGQVSCMMSNRADLSAHMDLGEAKVLAVAGYERLTDPRLRDAPTFTEAGYPIIAYLRQGIGVSRDVPEERYRFLSDAFERMIHGQGVKEALEAAGLGFKYMPGPAYKELWDSERTRWEQALDRGMRERIREQTRKWVKGARS